MEAFPKCFIVFSFLFIPLSFSGKSIGKADERQQYAENVIKVSSVVSTTTCSLSAPIDDASNGPLIQMVYRHGPCSPSWLHGAQGTTEWLDQFSEESLLADQIRVASIHTLLSQNSLKPNVRGKKVELPVKSGLSSKNGIGSYIVQVGFGTPTKSITLMVDSGSDLTWIQCDRQFDTSRSSSYSSISCNTTECSELQSASSITKSCYDDSTCRYVFKYAGMSSTGYFAKEKITLNSDVFQGFKFGCGLINKGKFGSAAGLLGLGRNKLSFVSQTSKNYEGVFSYCLPSTLSSTGYLSFGAEKGNKAYESVTFTPLVTDRRGPSFYFIKMTAIIVDSTKLPISASVFKTSGMIIDSVTSITRLPPNAYAALKLAFVEHMSSYPTAEPTSVLDTCYNLTGIELFTIPQVTLVFEGNVEVDMSDSAVVGGSRAGQLCLAFAGNDDPSDVGILGNLQQQKMKVVYDIPNKRVGFGPIDCN